MFESPPRVRENRAGCRCYPVNGSKYPGKTENKNMRSISPRAIVFAAVLLLWAIYSMAADPLAKAAEEYQAGRSQWSSE